MPISKKASTPARKRQWQHVEDSMLDRGASPKRAAMAANAVVRDHPAKSKLKGEEGMMVDVIVLDPKEPFVMEADGTSRAMTSEEIARLTAPRAELRPPPEHAEKMLHWLDCGDGPAAFVWCRLDDCEGSKGRWRFVGNDELRNPRMMAHLGYRYLGPAEWREPGEAERENAALRESERLLAKMLDQRLNRIATLEAQNARLLQQVADLEAAAKEFHTRWVRGDSIVNPPSDPDALGMPTAEDCAALAAHIVGFGTVPAIHRAVEATVAPPTIRKGDFVTCEAGHLVCEVMEHDLHDPTRFGFERDGVVMDLGAWRLENETAGAVTGTCPCGARFSRIETVSGPPGAIDSSGAVRLHIKGRGWV